MTELKNLQARDLTGIGTALKKAFDLLNQYRLQTGIDNYGQALEALQHQLTPLPGAHPMVH